MCWAVCEVVMYDATIKWVTVQGRYAGMVIHSLLTPWFDYNMLFVGVALEDGSKTTTGAE